MTSDPWVEDVLDVFAATGSQETGLSSADAAARHSPAALRPIRRHSAWRLLLRQFTSPVMIVLIVATGVSLVVSDPLDGLIILVIIMASGLLGFVQERRADIAMVELLGRVQVHADVLRDGQEIEVAVPDVVVGDVVILRAGDIAPADMRLFSAEALLVDESSITGEPDAVEKSPVGGSAGGSTLPVTGVFFGSHVRSGTGRAVVVSVGSETRFGSLVEEIEGRDVRTRFEREMTSFGMLLARVVLVLVAIVLAINLLLQRGVIESLMFALAVAVGVTPQLLPAIVTVSLSLGARRMAQDQVLVKRLDAIEDIGAMTLLCCDKTGTLTAGVVELDAALDPFGASDPEVLRLASINAGLQRGYANPMDEAILRHSPPAQATLIDEVPYDFERRRLSVLAQSDGSCQLIAKGAFASVLGVCTSIRVGGSPTPLDDAARERVRAEFAALSAQGFRVLGVASKDMPGVDRVRASDEDDLTLVGLLAFMDPPTESARHAVGDLRSLGVDVALVTGDNALVARHVADSVGLRSDAIMTGKDIASMSEASLVKAVQSVRVFAEVDPLQKEQLVLALRGTDQTVGFLGDGINDSAALRAADAGISVDAAADVAKHAAALVILTKDLGVIADGIRLGRRTFANTMKYIRVTISANFGNMVSLVIASAFLPFLPLLPVQILLLNLLSDVPSMAMASDRVDESEESSPRWWDLHALRDFMIVFGLVSSVFDLASFAVLRFGFAADDLLFRSSWFVLSLITEVLALLVLRTGRPFWRSRPGTALMAAAAGVIVFGVALPFTAVAGFVGLGPIPLVILGVVAGLCLAYVIANEVAKWGWRRRRGWQAM